MSTHNDENLPAIKLYWLNESRAQRFVWLLEELRLPFELEVFHRNKETLLAPPELEKIHPLGKVPIITLQPHAAAAATAAGNSEAPAPAAAPIVLAESGFMIQYLCEHFGSRSPGLVPPKWRDGMQGQVGGETEAWMRFQYLLHYGEGSLMPILVMTLVMSRLKSPSIPFFIRPVSSTIANRVIQSFIFPNARRHFRFIEHMLATSSGDFLCGPQLTAADVLLSFPVVTAIGRGRLAQMGWPEDAESGPEKEFPLTCAYVKRLEALEGYQRAEERVRQVEEQARQRAGL